MLNPAWLIWFKGSAGDSGRASFPAGTDVPYELIRTRPSSVYLRSLILV